MDEEQLEAELKRILRENDAEFCTCEHEIGFGDISWNNAYTEYGTPHATVEVDCQECGREIAYSQTWTEIENTQDVLDVLENDWKNIISK